MATVYIALGSNLGDRLSNLNLAIGLLNSRGITVLKCSHVIESAPAGGPSNQGNYLNAVLKAQTVLQPEPLLNQLKAIERRLGRKQTIRNGPRPIDLDILLYDNLKMFTPRLTIPHPRMHERRFVLEPLLEIEPRFREVFIHARH